MHYRWMLFVALFAMSTTLHAQPEEWRFRWKKDQVSEYKVSHVTTVTETIAGAKAETVSNLELTKQWKVAAVDAQGVADMRLVLLDMKHEQKKPGGETLIFDSKNPEKSTPELKEQLAKFVGTVVSEIRINDRGQVVDVKKGSLAKFQAEPPFVLVLPAGAIDTGRAWVRPFTVTLDPPFGAGEKLSVKQKYAVEKIVQGKAVVDIITEFTTWPENPQEQLPLLQKEVQGKAQFDFKEGRLEIVRLKVDKTVENHQGKGSTYRFVSVYREDLISD